MKLLGWMNRKSRQDSIEPRKTSSAGISCACFSIQPSFGKQLYHLEHGYTSAHSNQTNKESSRYSAVLTAIKGEEVHDEEVDFFHGFLTVGTLGSESEVAEPATPKFAISYQNVDEKQTEVTETDLKLINDKLEEFLEAEAADYVDYDSSKRSSFVSTITLSDYQTEGNDVEDNKNMATCPLQEYLFNSSKECVETGKEMIKKEKGSLEDNYKTIGQLHDEQKKEGTPFKGECAIKFMKNILKKIHVSSSSSKAYASDHATSTVSTKKKFPKAFGMLNKNIYPERSIADKKLSKSHDYKDKTEFQDTGVTILGKGTTISITNYSLHGSHSTEVGEHWIKTDADYLVLEL